MHAQKTFVVIRGTLSINDLISDIFCIAKKSKYCNHTMHAGFLDAAELLYEKL